MAKIRATERVLEYSKEFKVKVVNLTDLEGIQIKQICACLDLHPFMVSRWRKQVRDGTLVAQRSGRVQMATDKTPTTRKQVNQIKKLKKQNAQLKKENDLLKKWQQYLKEVRQNDSDS